MVFVRQHGQTKIGLSADTKTGYLKLISVLKTDVKKVEDLTNRVLTLISDLEKEYKDVLTPVATDEEEK